jgi:hypothetical protein
MFVLYPFHGILRLRRVDPSILAAREGIVRRFQTFEPQEITKKVRNKTGST